jgi:4a-hydroxytetrahydrobiopterin dehydratase
MNDTPRSPLSTGEVKNMLDQVEGWYVKMDKEISKEFSFKDFKEALAFVNKVGEIAEKEGHHPNILLYDYNKVRISLSTHSVGGLSEKDFEMAQKVEE